MNCVHNISCDIDWNRISRIEIKSSLSLRIVIITCWARCNSSFNSQNISISCSCFDDFSFYHFSRINSFKCGIEWEFISESFSFSTLNLNWCCTLWYWKKQRWFDIVSCKILRESTHFCLFLWTKYFFCYVWLIFKFQYGFVIIIWNRTHLKSRYINS